MNILVLSDNTEVLARAKPIFEKRKVTRWTFTNSDDINPKKDFKHIIDNYDLVFSLHCKKIFPKILTDSVRCINIHPGYLPWGGGMYPHVWAIIYRWPAGSTIHEMTDKIDAGPILVRWKMPVFKQDTSADLYKRIIDNELLMLDHSLDDIIADRCKELEPAFYPGIYKSKQDFKKLCEIDPMRVGTFNEFYDLLRALSHDGYQNAHFGDTYFTLHTHTKNENINTHTTHTHTE